MVIALGHLGWAPETFWRATIVEWTAAFEGWCEMNGHDPYPSAKAMDRLEFEELKSQFPDSPKPKPSRTPWLKK